MEKEEEYEAEVGTVRTVKVDGRPCELWEDAWTQTFPSFEAAMEWWESTESEWFKLVGRSGKPYRSITVWSDGDDRTVLRQIAGAKQGREGVQSDDDR